MATLTIHHPSRTALLQAARELVFTRSVENVGTAEICQRAGVRKGSLYHFFSSKEDLVLVMLEDLMQEFEHEVLLPSLNGSGPVGARIEAFVQAIHAFQAREQRRSGHLPGCPFGNVIVETATYHPTLRRAVKAHLERIAAHFERTLGAAVERGELPTHTDTHADAERWLALMEGILVMAKVAQDPDTILRLGSALNVLLGLPQGAPTATSFARTTPTDTPSGPPDAPPGDLT